MMALVSVVLIIGVFLAGHWFAVAGFWALVLLGFAVICLGLLVAAAETAGFQGQYVELPTGVTWGSVSHKLFLMNENKARFFNDDKLYVQTPTGPRAVTAVFTARINHELSIILEAEPDALARVDEEFNRLKQGVI